MAELELHPNDPRPVQFPCPDCGRGCLLTPHFYTDGAARGVRHGHGLQHSLPPCRTYLKMTPLDFLKLATFEVPVLRDNPHVSVKEPLPPPALIVVDMGNAQTTPLFGSTELEQHARDVAAFEVEAKELATMRNRLRAERKAEEKTARRRRVVFSAVAVAAGGGLFGLHLQPVYATVIVVFLLWKIWA